MLMIYDENMKFFYMTLLTHYIRILKKSYKKNVRQKDSGNDAQIVINIMRNFSGITFRVMLTEP